MIKNASKPKNLYMLIEIFSVFSNLFIYFENGSS
jgi:hypothetical protein